MTSPSLDDLLELGWKVFPCHSIKRGQCTCRAGRDCSAPGKHPRTKNGVKDASNDPAVVHGWADQWPDSNWALACGRASGIFVIDIDQRQSGVESFDAYESARANGPLPGTLKALSGGGGRHLIFTYPDVTIKNSVNWLPGVDIRSDGGYIVIPPATHISGAMYQWMNWGMPVVEPPADFVRDIVQHQLSGNGSGSVSGKAPIDEDAIARYVEDGLPEGIRNETLFRIASKRLRQWGPDAEDRIRDEFMAIMSASGTPRDEAEKTFKSAMSQDRSDADLFMAWDPENDSNNLTDLGNKNRLLKAHGDTILYVPQWGWLQWTDIGWQRCGDGPIRQLCETVPGIVAQEGLALGGSTKAVAYARHAMKSESAGAQSAMETLARHDPRVLRDVDDFDSDPDILACANGLLDLRTGKLRGFEREDLVTKNTGVIYDPSFKLDIWHRFLEETCQGDTEMIEYLQMAAGYTLTGSNAEECFFTISGPQASGKSTVVDAVSYALGGYSTTAQSDTFMYRRGKDTPKDELARLAGMRMVSVSEIREGESFNEALVKQFTGGDRVSARFLYRDSFEFTPQFKLWIATNHDPASNDDAMLRRIKRIKFQHTVPYERRDPKLKMLLRDPDVGGRAVLAWAAEGARKWYEAGRLIQPRVITEAVHEYKAVNDIFGQFLENSIVPNPGQFVSLVETFTTYQMWCTAANERPIRRNAFIVRMRDRGHQLVKLGDMDGFRDISLKSPMQSMGYDYSPVPTEGVNWG